MTMMNKLYTDSNTVTYLFNYALDHGIAFETTYDLHKETPSGKQFYCGESSSSPVEVKASQTGIKILADYYFYDVPKEDWNIDNFMLYYCIPHSYKDWILKYLESLY